MSTSYPTPPASPSGQDPYQQYDPYGPHYGGPQSPPRYGPPGPHPQYGGQPYTGQPYGPQPYGPQPYGPQPYGPQPVAAPTSAPASVVLAFRLLLGQIAVWVVTAIVALATGIGEDGNLRFGTLHATGSSFAVVVGVVMVFTLIGCGLWLLFGVKMQQGRNWARIVLTVFGLLTVLSTVVGIASSPLLATLLNLVAAALIVGMIVCMFRADAKSWFAPRP